MALQELSPHRTAPAPADLAEFAARSPPADSQVGADETMFGGSPPGKRGWGAAGKVMVFGLYQRNGPVLTFPISSREQATLLPLLEAPTCPGSLHYTDAWHAHAALAVRGTHVGDKQQGRPTGRDHLNDIEGFWSYAKHWLYQYRGVPACYFHLYLKEVESRFNLRHENLVPLLKRLLRRCTP